MIYTDEMFAAAFQPAANIYLLLSTSLHSHSGSIQIKKFIKVIASFMQGCIFSFCDVVALVGLGVAMGSLSEIVEPRGCYALAHSALKAPR